MPWMQHKQATPEKEVTSFFDPCPSKQSTVLRKPWMLIMASSYTLGSQHDFKSHKLMFGKHLAWIFFLQNNKVLSCRKCNFLIEPAKHIFYNCLLQTKIWLRLVNKWMTNMDRNCFYDEVTRRFLQCPFDVFWK